MGGKLRIKVNPLGAPPCNIDGAAAKDIIWTGLGKVAYSKRAFV